MDFALTEMQTATSLAEEQDGCAIEIGDAHLAMVGGGIGDVVPA